MTEERVVLLLSKCTLFRGISPEERLRFLEKCPSQKVLTFRKEELVLSQGTPIGHLYILLDGLLRAEMITEQGDLLGIELLSPVFPLAPALIFGEKSRFPVEVTAQEESTLLRISKGDFLDNLLENRTLLQNFLAQNAAITEFLTEKLQMLSLKSLRKKVALFLLRKIPKGEKSFTFLRTRTELAEFLGVRRQSLARVFKELEDEGLINLEEDCVTILDRARLARVE